MGLPIDSIICHDVTQPFPLPDQSIDVVITSPPYWGLRDYGIKSIFDGDPNCKHEWGQTLPKGGRKKRLEDGDKKHSKEGIAEGFALATGGNFCKICNAWKGQLGLEPNPQMFIDHLVMICQEIKRVLKKSGSFYLNIGDTYYGSGGAGGDYNQGGLREGQPRYKQEKTQRSNWIQPKQLLGIPERVMIALQNDGWILRNKNVWYKLNSMPSSVKDRLNNTWEPVFHFVKARKYYYDLDAIREPHKATSLDRAKYDFNMIPRAWEQGVIPVSGGKKVNIDCHPAGKNPGDVVKHDLAVGRIGNFSYNDPLHTKEYHPSGKNPGDIIQFDEEYWWNFILGRAHPNKFYKKAFEIMKEWMIKNNCFDYAIFYEWYREEFEGKWESGTLEKGKANYLSDEKRLPFPKPETRFLGDMPGDFWGLTTQPFTGYNPDLEHFAVFPENLVLKPLKAACPKEICKKCGKPKRKVVETGGTKEAFNIRVRDVKEKRIKHTDRIASETEVENYDEQKYVSKIRKYVIAEGCKCNVGFDAGIVLDPFCGRGTVGKVAKSLGLHYILFDAKPEYCELARLYIDGQKHKLHKNQGRLDSF